MNEINEAFNVLNTTGGGIDGGAIFAIVLFAIFAFIFVWLTYEFVKGRESQAFFTAFAAVVFVVLTIFAYTIRFEPVRYEVTVKDGHVIDAALWEIVEQRGQIYVIEERTQPEAEKGVR